MNLSKLKAAIHTLLARKLVMAFLVGFAGVFLPAALNLLDQIAKSGPATFSLALLWSTVAGAVAAGVRAVILLSPLPLIPSDAAHTAPTFKPHTAGALETAPHPEFEAHRSFAHLKLGKSAPHRDSRTLELVRYLTSALPTPPASYIVAKGFLWPMYGNDRLGDCTAAAIGHMIQAWTAAAGLLKTLSNAIVVKLYWLTGTPPANTGKADGPTDTGRVELDMLNYWRKTGVSGHKIAAYTSFPPANKTLMKVAVAVFGGAYVGIAMPITAQTQTVWDVVGNGKTGDSAPGSWGGHAVYVVGYDAKGIYVVTWGAVVLVTWRFVKVYFDEAYAIVADDWLNANGQTPAGLDLAQLNADLAAIPKAAA